MLIKTESHDNYLFRPSNLREFRDTLDETLAEFPGRAPLNQERLHKMLDLIEALQRAVREGS